MRSDKEHAVPEHVAGHVANADRGELIDLRIQAQLAEVPPDRLPGAASRDPHCLVVITGGTAGGERVPEPEAVFERDLIGYIGEGRCAFVGGDHEVRVVTVVPNDIGGRLDPAVDQVVGDREQARDESPVAGDPFGARFLGGRTEAGGPRTRPWRRPAR